MANENESMERARKAVDADKELLEVSRKEFAERMKGKPTPTQEENDLAACGAHITEHEDDGSGPDPFSQTRFSERQASKDLEKGKAPQQGYQTRQATPRPPNPTS